MLEPIPPRSRRQLASPEPIVPTRGTRRKRVGREVKPRDSPNYSPPAAEEGSPEKRRRASPRALAPTDNGSPPPPPPPPPAAEAAARGRAPRAASPARRGKSPARRRAPPGSPAPVLTRTVRYLPDYTRKELDNDQLVAHLCQQRLSAREVATLGIGASVVVAGVCVSVAALALPLGVGTETIASLGVVEDDAASALAAALHALICVFCVHRVAWGRDRTVRSATMALPFLACVAVAMGPQPAIIWWGLAEGGLLWAVGMFLRVVRRAIANPEPGDW